MKKIILLTSLLFFAVVINVFAQGTWTAQTSGVTTSLNCVSTVDANVGWIGGDGGVVLRTTNGGTTWTNVTTSTIGTLGVYAICAIDANICIATTSTTTAPTTTYVYRTSNGGANWTQVFTEANGGFMDDIKFKDANTGFMYGDPPGTRWSLWKTTNGGINWDSAGCYLPVTGTEAGWNNSMQIIGNTIWFGTNNTKVYKSTNFGATGSWTSGVTTGTANSYSVAFNGNIGFSGQTVAVKSTDGGSTYASVTLPGSGTCYSFCTIQGSNKFWYNRAAIIYGSTDNGATFATQFTGTGTYQAMSMAQSGQTIRGWSVTSAGLIAMYNESVGPPIPTGTWTEQTTGLTTALNSVSAVSDNVAWTCGDGGKVLRTTNKGLSWIDVSGNIPTANSLYNIFAWDANIAICTTSPSTGGSVTIYKTSNGGVNWITGFSLTASAAFGDDLWMTSATDAYYIGDPQGGNWHLLKSTNGGDNWSTWATLPTTNTSGTYNNAAWFQGQQVWFCSNGDSKVNYTSNMGVNWSEQTIPIAQLTSICFSSETVGIAGGYSSTPGLLKTTNSGTTWTAITNPYPTSTISGIVGASTTWWVAQQGTGISISTNDGTSWSTAYTAPAGNFLHVVKSRSGATIWGVRQNGAISRFGQPISGINTISNEVPASYSLSQNYPNPFNPSTKISFALPKSGLVTLKVYNILGKEVATLVNGFITAGTHSYEFDGASLSSGVYMYKIESNGFTDIKKMMLVK
jgi:photosystem II stability/assembly factor-like uncharacterized protein